MSPRIEDIDENLETWDEVKGADTWSLLLGNGFSQNISRRFGYRSLFEVAQNNGQLRDESCAIFREIGNSNFEEVLRHLHDAQLVARALTQDENQGLLRELETNVRNALVASVREVHIEHSDLSEQVDRLRIELRKFQRVFTTNYDLIPYWALMADGTGDGFTDFFWGMPGNYFDADSDNYDLNGRTGLYFVHGALHLYRDEDRKIVKRKGQSGTLLANTLNAISEGMFPHFISEGTSKQKLNEISSSEYLRFALHELKHCDTPALIFGHSLSQTYDQHLIDSFKHRRWTGRKVAVTVHPSFEPNIRQFKLNLHAQLPDLDLRFIDSRSHPLGEDWLNCDDPDCGQ